MSEMVERVALAIDRECRLMGDGIGSGAAKEAARAAIEAMREPPKGFEMIVYHGDYGDDIWREMIEAALR
jgi:hypothetical protein